ncbi:MAG: Rid family hydrolase [Dysgonomonas sp.]
MEGCKVFSVNNIQTPEYHIALRPDCHIDFAEQLNTITQKYEEITKELDLTNENLIFAKIFISDYVNLNKYLVGNDIIQRIFQSCAVSIIEQPPLDGTNINLFLYFIKSDHIEKERNSDAIFTTINGLTHIYQSVTKFDSSAMNAEEQTRSAFVKHMNLLSEHNLKLKDNCVRTWLYSRDVDRDYAAIVKARNAIFDEEGLTRDTHYIASTGIEGKGLLSHSSVNIDFYSIDGIGEEQIQYLQALDYLNNTSEYGVTFERGTSIKYTDKKHIFISGTASIDKYGNCVHRNNVLKQTERLFTNIEMLLNDAQSELKDIAQMIVYLRNSADYACINKYLEDRFGSVPKAIVLGRVCRPEWLIEVECIAVNTDQ